MSFKAYVLERQQTDSPQGDFVADVKRDPDFLDPKSWEELRLYLAARGACAEAIEAGRAVWQQYRAKAGQGHRA